MKRRTDKDAEGILSLTEDIRGVLSSIRGEEEDARDGGFVPAADAAGDGAPAAPASGAARLEPRRGARAAVASEKGKETRA